MPHYVVISSHEPSQCPGANKHMGEVMSKLMPELPKIGQKHGVKPVGGLLHLDPAHKLMITLEAPNADAVLDTLNENRVAHVSNVEVYRAVPMEELMKKNEALGQQPLY